MQNCPKCVVMETRYMVDTASQELPIEEKTFLKFAFSSALFFFSNDANGTSNFADFLTNMCISINCVRSVFFFKLWLALCEVDFCWLLLLWHIKLLFLTSMWVVIYPCLTNYCYSNNYRPTWIQILACECFFFPFIVYCFRCLLLFFVISPCFYCLSCLLNLSNYKHQKNVGLVIIQRVVMRCSIEGRQKTVSNSLVSISEIKANLWLSAFWFVYCTCICCGSDLIFGLNFFNLGTNNGGDFPQESLLAIYNRIKKVQYFLF